MRIVIFGASGMVGAGALQECLESSRVTSVLVIGRSSCAVQHPKLEEILHRDFTDYSAIQHRFADCDACFYCLGVSSVGMDEAAYRHVTYDFTLAAARSMVAVNQRMTFCFVSGAGTDSTERGRIMWARVKGETENALLRLPFKAAYMLRPGFIQPLKGVRSKTRVYQIFYTILAPLFPIISRVASKQVTTTVVVGRAMINLAEHGYARSVLETGDLNGLGVAGSV